MTLSEPANLTLAQQHELQSAKRAARALGLVLPLLVILLSTVLLVVWLPRMPEPAAIHWGFSGHADGFGSPWTYVWQNLGIGVGVVLMLWLSLFFGGLKPGAAVWSGAQRFLAAFSAGYGFFTAAVNVGSAYLQLDLDDAREASGASWVGGLGFLIWLVTGALAWAAQPRVVIRAQPAESSPALALSDTERAVWFGEVRPSRSFFWITSAALALLVASVVFTFAVVPEAWLGWLMLALLVVVVLLSAASSYFRVRIDASGLEARSLFSLPTFRLSAGDVRRVEVRRVEPMAEFGGWGMRWAPGQFGLVMRAGQGLVVTQTNGRVFVLTVDEPELAAAALTTAANRARGVIE